MKHAKGNAATTQWLGESIWPSLRRLSKRARRREVAVAYVSSDTQLRLARGDTLIVNASVEAIRSGQTSAAVLAGALRRKALIFSHPKLHAKVYLLDSQVVIGSANLSSNSLALSEACVLSSDGPLVERARSWFARVRAQATRLDRSAIDKLQKIPVIRRGGPARGKPTLLQALEQELSVLDDLVFGIYWKDAELTTAAVRREAKRRGVPLPADSVAWTWFEEGYSRRAELLTRRTLADRPMVALYGQVNEGAVTGIYQMDDQLYSFIECYRVGSTLVSVFDVRKRPPVRLNSGRRELCRLLSDGLDARPKYAKAWHAQGGFLQSRSLLSVLRAGQRAS